MDGSEYQKVHFGRVEGRIPDVDLELEARLQAALREAIRRRLLKSAHDLSEGGLAVALAECAIAGGATGGAAYADPTLKAPRFLGAHIDLGSAGPRPDLMLFGEGPSRVVVSLAPENVESFTALLADLPHSNIGRVTAGPLTVIFNGESVVSLPVAQLHEQPETTDRRPHRR